MNKQRLVALYLILTLGLIIVVMIGALYATHRVEVNSNVLLSEKKAELMRQLDADPRNKKLQDQVREKDAQLRHEYFTNRGRYQAAAFILLGGIVLFVLSAGWYFKLTRNYPPAGGVEVELRQVHEEMAELKVQTQLRETREKELKKQVREAKVRSHYREQIALATAVVGLVLVGGLAALALFGTGALKRADWIELASHVGDAPVAVQTPDVSVPTPDGVSPTPAPTPDAPVPAPTGFVPVEDEKAEFSWPAFRGVGNLGIAAKGDYPKEWNAAEEKNIPWRSEVPMPGKSSPIVWNDRIFVTGADEDKHYVFCFDRSTGEMLWEKEIEIPEDKKTQIEVYGDTGYAACTPATDGKRVYAMYASGHLAALDFEGNQLWLRSFGENQSSYGYASSLLAHKGLVFVQWDHDDKKTSGLYAVRGDNGEEFYKVEREATASWTSPSIVSTVKGDQLILIAPERITAYEPLTGKEIWRSGWYFCEPGPSAAWGNGMVYITSDGAETLAIKTDGEGDITQSHVAWKADDALPDTSSPVSSGDHLLQCASGGYLACFKTADGSVAWEHYLPAGATGSPIFVGDDTVYLTTDDGITQVFKLGGDQYEEIGKGDALDSVFATPAFVDGKIYIRGENYLTAIGKNDK